MGVFNRKYCSVPQNHKINSSGCCFSYLFRKKAFVIFLFLIFNVLPALSVEKLSPVDFGLSLSDGQIAYDNMTPAQKDTIAIGLFNPEDYYLDIAVYYPLKKQIVIYRNTGVGTLTMYNTFQQTKEVRKIEIILPEVYSSSLLNDLKVIYKDSSQYRITNREINTPAGKTLSPSAKVPLWDPLHEPRAFVYDISFVEQWRSQRSGHPQDWVALGDIDNDNKNEAVYTFWPINDTQYFDEPSTITVLENVSQNQYRVDWDTTLYYVGGHNIFSNVTDFDHDGNKEFFVRAKDQTNHYRIMICECTGEGKYKFKYSPIGGFASQPMEIQVKDSSVFVNGEPKADVWICESFPPPYSETHVSSYRFNTKSSAGYSFYVLATPTANVFGYSLSVGDIDHDCKVEYILGTSQWSSYYFVYLDSTGVPTNQGYEKKIVDLNEPLCVGYSFTKDFDGDGFEEGALCGFGYGTGSIGILKHFGEPGQSSFNVVWWDSTDLVAMPNMGIDTGYINNYYSILYPTVRYLGNMDYLNIITYTRNGAYSFYKTCFQVIDSSAFIHARLFDIDKDNKMNIISSMFIQNLQPPIYYSRDQLVDLEQVGVIGINPISKEVPQGYKLFQNYPNPFNPTTIIRFDISKESSVEINCFDILGRKIKTIFKQTAKAGSYKAEFDGRGLSSGVYFYVLLVDGKRLDTKKMLLLK